MAADERYFEHVQDLERELAPPAFSNEKLTFFLDGTDVQKYYEEQWRTEEGRARLKYRTPLSIERDRILYSEEMRRLADKYHFLFQGSDRILRNYTTQTLRTAHVARVIAQALRLNSTFAEGLALGAKVGAVPFVHRAKGTVDTWIKRKVAEIDKAQDRSSEQRDQAFQRQLFPDDAGIPLPSWVDAIGSKAVATKVAAYIPWAAGESDAEAYSSGKQSYWLLSTDPYLRRPRARSYLPQTMYGVWRHSRGQVARQGSFLHRSPLWDNAPAYQGLTWRDATHEAYLVQYADDITWAIENLNDANAAAALAGKGERSVYNNLSQYLSRQDAPDTLLNRVNAGDSGGIYTYFITDIVETSARALAEIDGESLLGDADAGVAVSFSSIADQMLNVIQQFLATTVFMDVRVANRNVMLEAITGASLDILYEGEHGIMDHFIERRSRTQGWVPEEEERARQLLADPVHRVQLSVDIFAAMSDEEVYDFAGLDAI